MFRVMSWKPIVVWCVFISEPSELPSGLDDNLSLVFRLNHVLLNKPLLSTLKQWQKLQLKITDTNKSVSLKEELSINAMMKKIVIEKTH